ncbi:MAG: hypothetical protein NVSMB25_03780 [Thermoleophilaceae bacterium]
MSVPYAKRITPADQAVEARADRGVMARSLMYVFALGGTLALTSLAVASQAHLARVAITAAAALGVAAILLAGYDHLPGWAFQVFVATGSLLVDWTLYAGGSEAPAYSLLLFCAAAYAMFFFTKLEATFQLALILGGYLAAMALRDSAPTAELVVGAVALAAGAGLVGIQRAHTNRMVWKLGDVARTDVLTGLLNRRGFEELIETEIERSRRSGQPLSLIVGDLDHFKALNDTFGHTSGDRALEQLALILETAKRRIDTASRIGGEEFAVILPDSDHHAAYILAERMRREVRETFIYEPHELTISIGVATFPIHGSTVDALINHADEALYAAKSLGRDRTIVFSEVLPDSVLEATGEPPARTGRNTATVLGLAEVIDAKDAGTRAHSQTVGRYAGAIARELGLPDNAIDRVRFGGIVHDVGKIGIPEGVLEKPGWLDADDWLEVRRHPEIGARIISGSEIPQVGEWVKAHHERPDGTGYPAGLSGPAIPLEARILAVADAFEAMTSDRVYRSALSTEEAKEELLRCAGTQFDRRVVDAFLKLLDASSSPRGLRLVK